MKENQKPYVYKQLKSDTERYGLDSVLFVERSGELLMPARLNTKKVWSRRETKSEKGEA